MGTRELNGASAGKQERCKNAENASPKGGWYRRSVATPNTSFDSKLQNHEQPEQAKRKVVSHTSSNVACQVWTTASKASMAIHRSSSTF